LGLLDQTALGTKSARIALIEHLYRERGYVAMSRGRQANRLYVVNAYDERNIAVAHADERRPPPLDAAAKALARSAAQTSATDAALVARVSTSSTPTLEQRIGSLAREEAAGRRRVRRDKLSPIASLAAAIGQRPRAPPVSRRSQLQSAS
jgi:hypothetical protein